MRLLLKTPLVRGKIRREGIVPMSITSAAGYIAIHIKTYLPAYLLLEHGDKSGLADKYIEELAKDES